MISIVLTLLVIGILLWVIHTYVPVEGKILKLIDAVVLICVVFWLLQVFGVVAHGDLPIPQLRK